MSRFSEGVKLLARIPSIFVLDSIIHDSLEAFYFIWIRICLHRDSQFHHIYLFAKKGKVTAGGRSGSFGVWGLGG